MNRIPSKEALMILCDECLFAPCGDKPKNSLCFKFANKAAKYYAHKETQYKTNEEFFCDIHSHIESTRMYNDKKPIFEVSIHPKKEGKDSDYWGWKDIREDHLTMIYANKIPFSMCFPYGFEAEEKAGRGRAVPLIVREIKKVS